MEEDRLKHQRELRNAMKCKDQIIEDLKQSNQQLQDHMTQASTNHMAPASASHVCSLYSIYPCPPYSINRLNALLPYLLTFMET